MTLRRKLCDDFLHATRNWFAMATGRAPMALQSSLQACLEKHDCPAEGAELLRLATHDDLGKSVALDIATQASKSKDAGEHCVDAYWEFKLRPRHQLYSRPWASGAWMVPPRSSRHS